MCIGKLHRLKTAAISGKHWRFFIVLKRLFVIALLAAIPSFFATPAAKADSLVLNQWYSAAFGTDNPSPVYGPPYSDATDGPVLPGGFASSINAPSGTSWTITLAGSGTLTVTDLEASGDQFQMYDNGVLMTAAASPFTAAGQNPGQASPGNGESSAPCIGCSYEGEDINAALGDPNFSSATFALSSGVNDLTLNYIGSVGDGDMAFITESAATPEPSSFVLFGFGLLGLLVAFRRKLLA
jgi:hypothetical protein